jgi:hypothetical protein
MSDESLDWIETESSDVETEDDAVVDEYDITASPNDFNIATIVDFIERSLFEIPSFQRNYVWDIRRASKLIESILMGLPVPQIFLYEKGKNKYLVIDGQQRLMSIFYFTRLRFPRTEKRGSLRRLFDEKRSIPDDVLHDDAFFQPFALHLPSRAPAQRSRFHGLNYETLREDKNTLDLRTLRCVIIKQNRPSDDDSSIYEIFNRLNTGGINLTPQEIRASLYHSPFYDMLNRINVKPVWRRAIGLVDPDLRMRDVEVLLRGAAMLMFGDTYRPSMTRFLNTVSKKMKAADEGELRFLEALFESFLDACAPLGPGVFGLKTRKLSFSVFESVFSAVCREAHASRKILPMALSVEAMNRLRDDKEFAEAASTKSTDKAKVGTRLSRAREILDGATS